MVIPRRPARTRALLSLLVLVGIALAGLTATATPAQATSAVVFGSSLPANYGEVTSSPSGMTCGVKNGECEPTLKYGTVTFTAKPAKPCAADQGVSLCMNNLLAAEYKFAGWGKGGACAGSTSPTCTIPLQSTGVHLYANWTLGKTLTGREAEMDTDKDDFTTYPDCVNEGDGNGYCTDNCALGHIKGAPNQYWSQGDYGVCGTAVESGEMSIGAGKTHTYTLGDSSGNLYPIRACYWRSSSAVWPTAGFSTWSSSLTATNTASDTRHWSWGVFFSTEMPGYKYPIAGYGSGCVTEGGCVSHDEFYDFMYSGVGWGKCPSDQSESERRTPHGSTPWPMETLAPPHRTETATKRTARQGTSPGITVIGKRTRRVGRTVVACPSGTELLHADTAIRNAGGADVIEPLVDHTLRAATFTVSARAKDAWVDLHVVCRRVGASTHTGDTGHTTGSSSGDVHRTNRRAHLIHAGGGHDVVHASHRGATITGGHGDDHVIVTAPDTVVMGGPGEDYIESDTAGRSHIEGGAGFDILVSRHGRTIINSQDGRPGDVVRCEGSSRARVYIDRGDTVRGACQVVSRR
jgi:hypothetical protein